MLGIYGRDQNQRTNRLASICVGFFEGCAHALAWHPASFPSANPFRGHHVIHVEAKVPQEPSPNFDLWADGSPTGQADRLCQVGCIDPVDPGSLHDGQDFRQQVPGLIPFTSRLLCTFNAQLVHQGLGFFGGITLNPKTAVNDNVTHVCFAIGIYNILKACHFIFTLPLI